MQRLQPFDESVESALIAAEDEARPLPAGARLILILALGVAGWALPLAAIYIWH